MGLKVGAAAGQYHVEEVLGAGAMSIVYLATDKKGQQVAIKVLPENMVINPLAVKRFEREARLISQLDHPHIVRVFDFFYADTTPCLVMQYMPGGTLTQHLIASPQITLGTAVDLIHQVSDALEYAHRLNIIHRDIKLDNILLNSDGTVALGDFGLARAIGEATLTVTGTTLGTPYYMSPEQIQPGRFPLDYRSDLYALGILSYVLVTGWYPFTGTDAAAVMHKHLSAAPPEPTTLNPSLPPEINPVLMRAIAKDPDVRYESALHFVEELIEVASVNPDLPITVRPMGSIDPDAALHASSTERKQPPVGRSSSLRQSSLRNQLFKNSARTQRRTPWLPVLLLAGLAILGGGGFVLGRVLTGNQAAAATPAQGGPPGGNQTNPGGQGNPEGNRRPPPAGQLAPGVIAAPGEAGCSLEETTSMHLDVMNYVGRAINVISLNSACEEVSSFRLEPQVRIFIEIAPATVLRVRDATTNEVLYEYRVDPSRGGFPMGIPDGSELPIATPQQ